MSDDVAKELRCSYCGSLLDVAVPRIVEDGVVTSCGLCPQLRLTANDRKFLKSLRIHPE